MKTTHRNTQEVRFAEVCILDFSPGLQFFSLISHYWLAIHCFLGFDAVVASEVIEHVKDLEGFVRSCAVLAHPGSPLFFTTLNKTVLSRVLGVFIAEVTALIVIVIRIKLLILTELIFFFLNLTALFSYSFTPSFIFVLLVMNFD